MQANKQLQRIDCEDSAREVVLPNLIKAWMAFVGSCLIVVLIFDQWVVVFGVYCSQE